MNGQRVFFFLIVILVVNWMKVVVDDVDNFVVMGID